LLGWVCDGILFVSLMNALIWIEWWFVLPMIFWFCMHEHLRIYRSRRDEMLSPK